MTDDEVIKAIQSPGRFDATVESETHALRLIRAALPHAMELPRALSGQPYPTPARGIKAWFQLHPAEKIVGNDFPHVKYADWTKGKKGFGGRWGHLFFPPGSSG
jgi:hypothetical protein